MCRCADLRQANLELIFPNPNSYPHQHICTFAYLHIFLTAPKCGQLQLLWKIPHDEREINPISPIIKNLFFAIKSLKG